MSVAAKLSVTGQKHPLTYAFWSTINKIVLGGKFKNIVVAGVNNLPEDSGYILIANHSSRWDGLLIYHLINRPSNFLVHPNELKGFQGTVLKSMGAFPASKDFDLQNHIKAQLLKGEPVVIFPEGDVYRDGKTHNFKSGAARFALNSMHSGVELPVIPVAIKYDDDLRSVWISVGEAIEPAQYVAPAAEQPNAPVRALTQRMYREICHLRSELGARLDAMTLFNNQPRRDFARGLN